MRNDKEHWAQKAREYQAEIEAKRYSFVQHESFVRRMVLVETHRHQEIQFMRRQGWHLRAAFSGWDRKHIKIIKRVWVVVSFRGQTEKWTRIEMAKAHAAGRNYHYARYLMTKDAERWHNELTGR